MVKLKRKNPALPPIVQGKVVRNIDLTPLQISVVRVGRAMFPVDNSGAYRWQGSPGTYTFTARSIGYTDVKSEKIRLTKGDSISLDFRLLPGPPIEHKTTMHKR
jgi:hypothetical protein